MRDLSLMISFSGLSNWIQDPLLTPFESLREIEHLPAPCHMSLWMTGDNYTSDRSRTLQSAVKTAGAIAVRGPLDHNVMLRFFFPSYFTSSRSVRSTSYSYIFIWRRIRGRRSLWALRDLTIPPRSPVCRVCGKKKTFIFVSFDCKCDRTESRE